MIDEEFLFGNGFDREGPGMVLLDAFGNPGGADGAIEAQEARGQQKLVNAEVFPKEMQAPRELYEKLGFVFGEEVDDQFINCTFPPGWTKKATDHSMHTDVLDDKGRRRFGIFYKAAFYDRCAIAYQPETFYTEKRDWDAPKGVTAYIVKRAGSEEALFESRIEEDAEKPWEAGDKARAEARAWLTQNYPNWEDPMAYWEEA